MNLFGSDGGRIVRPALPKLLFPIAGIWLGIYISEVCAWNQSTGKAAAILALIGGVVLLLAFKIVSLKKIKSVVLAFTVALAIGFMIGLLFWNNMADQAEKIHSMQIESRGELHSFRILDDPASGAASDMSTAKLFLADSGSCTVRVFWKKNQKPLPMGTEFLASMDFKPLKKQQAYLHQKGLVGSVTLDNILLTNSNNLFLNSIYNLRSKNLEILSNWQGDGSALLKGVLLGETTELNASSAGRAYKATGLSHLVAVSGSHLIVIAALLSWFLRRLNAKRPVEVVVITIFLIAFVVLTGLQPSAIRATAMTFIASVGPLLGRRAHIPSALSVAAIAMLVLSPATAFSVGFWLSVFAVFGLTLFCPLITSYMTVLLAGRLDSRPRLQKGLNNYIVQPLAMTITAQLATICITAPLFSTVSLVSPLANLLVTPFVTVLVAVGVISLCFMPIIVPLADLLLYFLCSLAEVSVSIARFCSELPYASQSVALSLAPSIVIALLAAAALYALWPQATRKRTISILAAVCMVAVILTVLSALPVRAQVVMLDIGQGDAILIREGKSNVLVDTGRSDTALLKALARQNIHKLDALIITHLDDDHCGSADALVGNVSVDNIYFANGIAEGRRDDEVFGIAAEIQSDGVVQSLSRGDSIDLGESLSLEMLWPTQAVFEGGNDESICLSLEYDANADSLAETRMLLTGDLERNELSKLLSMQSDPGFDILKVGHHGSKMAINNSVMEQMNCSVALISVGANNSYGHPAQETLDVLDENAVDTYRTDLNGDIKLYFSDDRIEIHCGTIFQD